MPGDEKISDHEYLMARLAMVINTQEDLLGGLAFLVAEVNRLQRTLEPNARDDGSASYLSNELLKRATQIRKSRQRS